MVQPPKTGPVAVLGAVLAGRRRGCDAAVVRHAASRRDGEAMAWRARGRAIQVETGPRDGRRRMVTPRPDEGVAVGRDHGRRLRPQARGAVRRPTQGRPGPTDRPPAAPVAPTRVARPCAGEQPEPVWGGECTAVGTAAGWLAVAARRDRSSRQVVGGALRQRLDAAWVQEARRRARGRRHPAAGLRHHAARGRP